ncbi:hypothetical protein JCM14713_14290 [Desulfomicrobium salsuginis]
MNASHGAAAVAKGRASSRRAIHGEAAQAAETVGKDGIEVIGEFPLGALTEKTGYFRIKKNISGAGNDQGGSP